MCWGLHVSVPQYAGVESRWRINAWCLLHSTPDLSTTFERGSTMPTSFLSVFLLHVARLTVPTLDCSAVKVYAQKTICGRTMLPYCQFEIVMLPSRRHVRLGFPPGSGRSTTACAQIDVKTIKGTLYCQLSCAWCPMRYATGHAR